MRILVLAGLTSIFFAAISSAGDFESKLLQKFQGKNQSTADNLRHEVHDALARALSTGDRDPARLLDRLRTDLNRLQDDSYLPRSERTSLMQQVEDRVKSLSEEVAKLKPKAVDIPLDLSARKAEAEEPLLPWPGRTPHRRVGQMIITPNFTAVPTATSLSTNPVVSGDRRYVRIGFSGGFISFRSAILSTTVNVPDGGTAVLGGAGTVSEGRSEFGPPGQSSIPYLDRLFRNVGWGRDRRRTSINASVRIISVHEEEERFLQSGGRQ